HRTADEGGVDRGFNFNRGAETTLQRGADTGHLGFRELGRRGHRRAHDAFGFGAQVFVQARDFRQLGQATIAGQECEEAALFRRRGRGCQQRDRVGVGERRVAQQRRDLRIGRDAGGERQRLRPAREIASVARDPEGGAGVGSGEGDLLAHRIQISAASSSSSALWALASISRFKSFSAPATASADTWRRRSSRARLAEASISASNSAFCRIDSVCASTRAASTIWLARWCAWSMISLALLRATLSSSPALSWACASARWLLSAAARPSAIFCWRSSMALSSGGQTKVAISQISAANESAWAIRVRLMFMAVPVVLVGACGAHAGLAAGRGRRVPPVP